jgi:preprotein translocase subunit SecG
MSFELGLKIMLALYVVVALAMIGLILLQRGQGAQAGSGFGGGASATVFGARGSANFLSSSTKWLAVAFFALNIGMGVYISHNSKKTSAPPDLGVIGEEAAPSGAATAHTAPAAPTAASEVPVAPSASAEVPVAADAAAAPATSDAQVEVPQVEANSDESKQPESSN